MIIHRWPEIFLKTLPGFTSPWFSPGFCCCDAKPNPGPKSLFGRVASCGSCLVFSIPRSGCSGARWEIQMCEPCCPLSPRFSASLAPPSISVSMLGMNPAAHGRAVQLSRGACSAKMKCYRLLQDILRMNGAGEIPSHCRH